MKNPQILGRVLQEISFAHWGAHSALYQGLSKRRGCHLLTGVLYGVDVICEEGTTIVPRLHDGFDLICIANADIQGFRIVKMKRQGCGL